MHHPEANDLLRRMILASAVAGVFYLANSAEFCAAAQAQSPPLLVSSDPADGADNVTPGERKLVLVFNRDMADSFSWTKGGNLFPEVAEPPKWVTPRKCELLVKLEPNRLYTFGINGLTFDRFQDTDGVPVKPTVVSFRTTAPGGVEPVQFRGGPENLETFNALQKAIDQHYSYRDLRHVNWVQRFDSFRQLFLDAKTTDELTYHVADLLSAAEDPHISIEHDGIRYPTTVRSYVPNFSSSILAREVENLIKVNNTVYMGTYRDGIVYVLIASWANQRATDLSKLAEIMNNAKDAPGIIIDVRPNGGGNDLFCEAFARRFVEEPFTYEMTRTRDTDQPDGFTEPRERKLAPLVGGRQFTGKVAVLMGPANMSSCEAFLLMMKQVKQAQLIGQASFGSSGNPKPHDLGDGLTAYLPSWQAMFPDGELLEGQGVEPDILVETEPEDFETEDPVIQAALEWLRTEPDDDAGDDQ